MLTGKANIGIGRGPALLAALVLALGCSGTSGSDANGEIGTDLPDDAEPDATDPDVVDPGPESVTVENGDLRLVANRVTRTVSLFRGDARLMRFWADGLQLGRVDELDDMFNYDPYQLLVELPGFEPPWGFEWLDVTEMRIDGHDANSVDLQLKYGSAATATLRIESNGPGKFKANFVPDEGGDDIAYLRIRAAVAEDDAFYGLGAYLDTVNHRGHVRAMQIVADGAMEGGYNEAHVPVPFVIGTSGWGLFVENPYPGAFDVAAERNDHVSAVFGTGAASTEGLLFHMFAGERPLDLTRHYYDITGDPLLPARWALGPWIWRDEISGQAAVEDDLRTIRELDLATTGYWIDRPYANGVNSFDFHSVNYPDPQAMIDLAHDLGMRVAVWHTPYVTENRESSPETAALLAHAKENDFYPDPTGLRLNNWGDMIDLTNPDAYAWWQSLIRRYTDMGIEGFKLDYGEDVVPGILGLRNRWGFFDGSDERTMHSRFKLFYHRVYAQTLPRDGGFLLCRAGTYGDQVNVSVIWPGDLNANFAAHREPIDGSGRLYVGGLGASMIYGLNLGPSGFPFYGSDTGGYRNSPPDKETFMRWFQQTALSSVMQVGTSSNNVPWEFEPGNGDFDQEVLDTYRIYARLHLRLFPYEWTLAKNIAVDGRPIQRPFGLQMPELGEHPDDQYFFGDDLLVAPVIVRDQRERDVILPPGRWLDWWDGTVLDGGITAKVAAPLTRLPLFLVESGIVPLLRPTIDTIAPVADPDAVDSYATDPGQLYVRVFAGPPSSFTLFDGAAIGQELGDEGLRLTWQDGDEFVLGAVFEVLGASGKPVEVRNNDVVLTESPGAEELDGVLSGWAWDEAMGGTLLVKVPGGTHAVSATW